MIDIGQPNRQLRDHHFYAPSYDNPTPDPEADPPIVAGPPILTSEYTGAQGFGSGSFTISGSGTHTLTVTLIPGSQSFRVGYPIIVYAGYLPADIYVYARVSSVTGITPTENTVTFDVYDYKGSGSFATWYLTVQFFTLNFTQNENYSAYDTPVRSSYNGGEISLDFPTNAESTSVVTEDTPTHKSGYTETTYYMTARVTESEWERHRPYVGKTLNAKRTLTKTVSTYFFPGPPTSTTDDTEYTQTYTFSETDFDPANPGYSEGQPAIYDPATGVITQYPSPSICVTEDIDAAESTYKSYEYDDTFGPVVPGGPYVLLSYTRTSRSWSTPVEYDEPSPTSFFYPG